VNKVSLDPLVQLYVWAYAILYAYVTPRYVCITVLVEINEGNFIDFCLVNSRSKIPNSIVLLLAVHIKHMVRALDVYCHKMLQHSPRHSAFSRYTTWRVMAFLSYNMQLHGLSKLSNIREAKAEITY
jgi:hypothetical protein